MTTAERDAAEVDLDDLRRRLYRPDATDADLRRYLAERAAALPPAAQDARQDAPPASPRRHGLLLLAAGVVVLAIAAATTGALLPHRAAAPAPARTTAAAAPPQASGPARITFPIDGVATPAQRFEGVGDATVRVALPGAEFGTERAVVLLFSSRTATISWHALRVVRRGDATTYQGVAGGRVVGRADDATSEAFSYAGAPPSALVITAPLDLHWTLLIAAPAKAR